MTAHRTGCVNWPTHLADGGNSGMVVLAVWRSKPRRATERSVFGSWTQDDERDPFTACMQAEGMRFGIGECNDVTARPSSERRLFPADRIVRRVDVVSGFTSDPILGAIQLGSSRGSYLVPDGESRRYWNATRADLTLAGITLVQALDGLYDRAGEIVTILDT